MYPGEFDYYRAGTVEEAVALLADHDDVELLAGGHSLLPTMKSGLASVDALVDISEVPDLQGVEVDDGAVTVGAATTYADVLTTDGLVAAAPAFAEALGKVGDTQVRNRGTVGGNLAHADPGSDLPGVVLAADATVHATGPDGERTIAADDLFVATYTTALDEEELLTAVEFPALGEHDAGAYVKKENPASGYAMIGVAVRLSTDGEAVGTARVGVNGALNVASRLEPVEDAIEGGAVDDPELAGEAADHATDGVEEWELMEDVHASAEFRAHLLEVYTERAIQAALDRVTADHGAAVEVPPTR